MAFLTKCGVSRYSNEANINETDAEDVGEISVDRTSTNASTLNYDQPDASDPNAKFSWLDVGALVVSIGTFLFGTVTDLKVVYIHYNNGQMWYFGLTLLFVIVPTLTMTGFSLRWYILDFHQKGSPTVSTSQWVLRVVFLIFQLGPILRYMDALMFSLKMRKYRNNKEQTQRYNKRMSYEDADAALLRLFESFLEDAPQLILQIYILAQPSELDYNEALTLVISSFASWISLAWSLVAQHRSLRLSLPDVQNMSLKGTFVQFLWRLFAIGARVLAVGLFASLFPIHLAVIIAFRWIVMSVWIITMKTEFCDTKFEEFLYNIVLGAIFTFCYFNPKNDATRWRYFFYYLYTLTENAILISVWYNYSSPELWYRFPAVLAHFLSFFMAILFMVMYYLLLHPSKNIKLCSLWGHSPPENETQNEAVENGSRVEMEENVTDIFEEDLMEPRQPRKNRRYFRPQTKDKEYVDYLKIMAQIHQDNQSLGTAV